MASSFFTGGEKGGLSKGLPGDIWTGWSVKKEQNRAWVFAHTNKRGDLEAFCNRLRKCLSKIPKGFDKITIEIFNFEYRPFGRSKNWLEIRGRMKFLINPAHTFSSGLSIHFVAQPATFPALGFSRKGSGIINKKLKQLMRGS